MPCGAYSKWAARGCASISGNTTPFRRHRLFHRVWPTLKGSARFYLDSLMEEPSHRWLVTRAGYEFRDEFRKPNGETGCTCMGPTASMEMVRELLQNCVGQPAFSVRTPSLRAEIEKTLPRLPPLQISPTTGELQDGWRTGSALRSARFYRVGERSAARRSRPAVRPTGSGIAEDIR